LATSAANASSGVYTANERGWAQSCFSQFESSFKSSVAEWLACWTQAQKGPGSNHSRDANCSHPSSSVHQAAKLVAALLRVAGVTAGLAESNGNLPPGLWLTLPAGWLPRTGITPGTLRSVIEYGLTLPVTHHSRQSDHIRNIVSEAWWWWTTK